jgi:hypothetical protein
LLGRITSENAARLFGLVIPGAARDL